jgi:hypothetical protein
MIAVGPVHLRFSGLENQLVPGRHVTNHQMRWGGCRPAQTASQCAKLVVLTPLSGKNGNRDNGYDDQWISQKLFFNCTAHR